MSFAKVTVAGGRGFDDEEHDVMITTTMPKTAMAMAARVLLRFAMCAHLPKACCRPINPTIDRELGVLRQGDAWQCGARRSGYGIMSGTSTATSSGAWPL